MVSSELLQSWARTEQLLKEARDLLSPEVLKENEITLMQMVDFIEHNELGLAFDWLKSIAEESQWGSVELLNTLVLAAENMNRTDDASALRQRILELA
jgi:hypothetical protein